MNASDSHSKLNMIIFQKVDELLYWVAFDYKPVSNKGADRANTSFINRLMQVRPTRFWGIFLSPSERHLPWRTPWRCAAPRVLSGGQPGPPACRSDLNAGRCPPVADTYLGAAVKTTETCRAEDEDPERSWYMETDFDLKNNPLQSKSSSLIWWDTFYC